MYVIQTNKGATIAIFVHWSDAQQYVSENKRRVKPDILEAPIEEVIEPVIQAAERSHNQ